MPEFLVLLLMQLTVFSSITALIIIAVKQIFKCRIPPLIGAVMWIVLLARLLCPIFPESRISIYNYIPIGKNLMFSLTHDVDERMEDAELQKVIRDNPYIIKSSGNNTEDAEAVSEIPALPTEDDYSIGEYINETIIEGNSVEGDTARTDLFNTAVLLLYLTGVLLFVCCNGAVYLRAKRIAMLTSVPCTDEILLKIYSEAAAGAGIKESDLPELREGISSMLVGCIKPCIICRAGTEKREAGMLFAHELSHFKYFDNRILLFSTLIACFYWYNPLIWIVRSMLREDIEVLCDARTLDECGIVRTDYAMMLCRNSAFSELSYSAGCHMSASGRHLKTRLRTISRSQKQNLLSRIASVLLCSAIILVCLTNPIISQSNDYTEYIDNYSALTGIDDRELYLEDKVTVSQYLEEVSNILSEKTGEDAHLLLGRNLEKFKRICSIDENIPKELTKELRKLKTDEAMTNRSCALISQCIVYILSGGRTVAGSELTVLPEVISDGDLNEILLPLTEAEANAVRSCYNIGVKGAVTSFDRIYTEAMMKLILSRITNDWMREKFSGFYQKIEPAKADKAVYSDEMLDLLENIEVNGVIYVRDPAVTKAESVILRRILGAAFAGEDENAYYLKKTEDTCSFDTAEFLIKRGGYTAEKMLEGYAKLASGNASSSGIIAYPVLRSTDADLSVRGNAAKAVRTAAMNMYSLGIIDSEYQAVPGDPDRAVIDLGKHLSCGESLASAYRLAYYAINQQD